MRYSSVSFVLCLILVFACGFQPHARTGILVRSWRYPVDLAAAAAPPPSSGNDKSNSRGYQFGDITKGFIKTAISRNEKGTRSSDDDGDGEGSSYKFGDVTRGVVREATSRINSITGKDTYEFGDLSRFADKQVKARVANFTGKEEYVVGDLSKEVVRRIGSGEYATEDLVLLCKALVTMGVGLTPVARFLPAKLLLEMISFGLAEEVGGRLLDALVQTLDARFKETITGDPNYRLGDKTKQAIHSILTRANEKDNLAKFDTEIASSSRAEQVVVSNDDAIDASLLAELQDWDRRLGIDVGNETTSAV